MDGLLLHSINSISAAVPKIIIQLCQIRDDDAFVDRNVNEMLKVQQHMFVYKQLLAENALSVNAKFNMLCNLEDQQSTLNNISRLLTDLRK